MSNLFPFAYSLGLHRHSFRLSPLLRFIRSVVCRPCLHFLKAASIFRHHSHIVKSPKGICYRSTNFLLYNRIALFGGFSQLYCLFRPDFTTGIIKPRYHPVSLINPSNLTAFGVYMRIQHCLKRLICFF